MKVNFSNPPLRVIILIGALILMIVPWLGETLFNSKGEPREAIVAVSILESGNWILPTSYGGDIPYKPPFLAWIIAIFSLIFNGGAVNEFCSRLPSALAFIAMVTGVYAWLRGRVGEVKAAVTAGVLATSFEVFRSGVICRVDMLLTSCSVLALLLMFSWRERRRWWLIPPIILLLSGAVLTKGPVGALLPCLAMGIFCLLKRDNFFFTLGCLSAVCLASMILPGWWYWAAYQHGGQHFLDLAYEENIGRLTGTMGYDSHVNPWYYNLLTLLWGMLPWTLIVILGACVKKWRKSKLSDVGMFATTVALTVLIFYCLPSSKRSVYLLPMYPFLAYGVACILLAIRHSKALRVYNKVWIGVVTCAMVFCMIAPWLPLGKLQILPLAPWQWFWGVMILAVCIWLQFKRVEAIKSLILSTCALFCFYLSIVQPLVLNPKSDQTVVGKVETVLDAGIPVYSLIEDSLMRYYTLNFYTSDRLLRIESARPSPPARPFAVLVQEQSIPDLTPYASAPYDSTLLTTRSCDNRRAIYLYSFPKE